MTNNDHQQKKLALRIVGISLLICGGIFALIGFIDFFTAEEMPTKFWCLFVGFPLLGVGGMLTLFSSQQEMQRYIKNESIPVINEASEEIAPALRNTAQAIHEGFQESKIICECGAQNDEETNFCSNCGKQLRIVCPKCGKTLQADNKFCSGCGESLK